ncbi:hypothetical protein HBI56_022040 [Parastagonospora nodorum]|uniref:Uncharacterized protein n=1 Tax=Phaeosphaeria nodorum (strain SN15 / ATCC MYA-4574 / FGSC 10173) TaxID=321614 RepID=A0A7U2F0M4_PHANO|nr:hypothetical protein HBH56_175030 [Parastagonospora nodorum]QRC96306.1 hypothetical protein JI435_408660 [Parastagonospora nodorum SN15]KAH3926370.1 hypothetical protein HBH54_168140 [Parastagonospora nodorum]KAH3955750.1 hypothetical protein HBH53_000960 [Parastagonospora nodorum]KAH3965570.1 hypothetical protein HBH52_204800 [Parastagonospora nodorum]
MIVAFSVGWVSGLLAVSFLHFQAHKIIALVLLSFRIRFMIFFCLIHHWRGYDCPFAAAFQFSIIKSS